MNNFLNHVFELFENNDSVYKYKYKLKITYNVAIQLKVKIKATIGNGTKSDIAIDNIVVEDGACKTNTIECKFDQGASCLVTNDLCPGNECKKIVNRFILRLTQKLI